MEPKAKTDLTNEPEKILKHLQAEGLAYVSVAKWGDCKRCGVYQDLRCGACFKCADKIAGKNHGCGIHELWDKDSPSNRWLVME